MASKKQEMARKINWLRGVTMGHSVINHQVLNLTKDKELFDKWESVLAEAREKLKGAYL